MQNRHETRKSTPKVRHTKTSHSKVFLTPLPLTLPMKKYMTYFGDFWQDLRKMTNRLDLNVNCLHCGHYCTGKTVFCTPPLP